MDMRHQGAFETSARYLLPRKAYTHSQRGLLAESDALKMAKFISCCPAHSPT